MLRCSNRLRISVLGAVLGGAALSGCSDIYYDRRETILSGANDAVASNQVAQMVDPWPKAAANNNFSFNGEKMQGAVERYRTGKVINPVASASSTAYSQQQPSQQGAASSNSTSGASKP